MGGGGVMFGGTMLGGETKLPGQKNLRLSNAIVAPISRNFSFSLTENAIYICQQKKSDV